MKTSIMKSVCVAIVMLVSGLMTTSAQSNFFFDKKYENGRISSSTKYELGYSGLYEQTYKFEYSYNESGSMTKKERFEWNSRKEAWTPVYLISLCVDENSNTSAYQLATWNKKTKTYNVPSEKMTYQLDDEGNTTQVESIKKSDNEILVTTFSLSTSKGQTLLTKN